MTDLIASKWLTSTSQYKDLDDDEGKYRCLPMHPIQASERATRSMYLRGEVMQIGRSIVDQCTGGFKR